MPFDGTDFPASLEKLDAVIALLRDRKHWCKGRYFDERHSPPRHCLVGAMRAVQAEEILSPVIKAAIRQTDVYKNLDGYGTNMIERFNDYSCTTHDDIMLLLKQVRRSLDTVPVISEDEISTTFFNFLADVKRRFSKHKYAKHTELVS